MNAVATPAATTAKTIPMQVLVRGRIDAVRRHDKTIYTRIITPAPDPYSRPQTVEIRSKQRLGQPGDEVASSQRSAATPASPFAAPTKRPVRPRWLPPSI